MMRKIRAGASALAVLAAFGVDGAQAACTGDGPPFLIGRSSTFTMHINGGDGCGVRFILRSISIDRIEVTKPAHGLAGWNGNVGYPVVGYRSAKGYRGPDDFTFDIVGYQAAIRNDPGGPGRAHVDVHVDVQ